MSKIITKDFVKLYFSECKNKHALTLAASSSFFFLLCLVPLLYLITSGLGYFFDDGHNIEKVLKHFSSIIPAEVMPSIKFLLEHVNKTLQSQHQNVYLHRIFLIISSLGFFGSIWRAIEIITEEKAINSFSKMLKSLGGILISFILCAGLIIGPAILNSFQIIFKKGLFKDFDFIQKLSFSELQVHGVNLFSTIMLVLFFLFIASVIFTSLIIFSKFAFLSYVIVAKSNLVGNFGSFYSLLLLMLWIFISILSFYISIIFAITHSNVIRDNPDLYIDIDL
jgi:membrane protein